MFILRVYFISILCMSCGPSLEERVEQLGRGADEGEIARQELLLAKDRAVEPLLSALENPRFAASRSELVGVLVSLMMRVDDPRIGAALQDHLQRDPDPRVRARIARLLGMHKRAGAIEALYEALGDEDGEVRYQAILSLGLLAEKLSEEQEVRLREKARKLADDEHTGMRFEAQIHIENSVGEWLDEARQQTLQARLAKAESLHHEALALWPTSKQGNYRLARFYLDNGKEEKGMELLRRHGMLLDVPMVDEKPEIDGYLDEAVWEEAARADSFFLFSFEHSAAFPSEVRTTVYVGYTREALYIGLRAYDEHPDSLVVRTREFDGSIWHEDVVELFFDPGFSRDSYAHAGINSIGVMADSWFSGGALQNRDDDWNADAKAAAHVGQDFWSLEYELRFGQQGLPRPSPGDVWGFDVVRTFRGAEYSQWVRTYGFGGGHSIDDFGLLVFR